MKSDTLGNNTLRNDTLKSDASKSDALKSHSLKKAGWSDFHTFIQVLERKWKNGEILRETLEARGLFPLQIKINGPKSDEIALHFEKAIQWIETLKNKEKSKVGYGYVLIEKEIHFRTVGRNMIPIHAIIETLDDAVKLLKKEKEVELYGQVCDLFLKQWSEHPHLEHLKNWLLKYPFKAMEQVGVDAPGYLSVIRHFEENPLRNLYIRQLDIEGVDTKFIEKNQHIIGELLEILLPQGSFHAERKQFEDRFGLKKKPAMIRFRILDDNCPRNGCRSSGFTDITVPIDEFRTWAHSFERVFFTENEINFLCFPKVEQSIVIFGKGYGIRLLRDVEWLSTKKVYYWGDIDTHGFNILSAAREFLPNLKSFLMTEEVLLSHRPLWVKEESQFLSKVKNLDAEEQNLLTKLQNNTFGSKVRLEQERIRYQILMQWIAELLSM